MPSSACQKSARSEEHTSELQSHDNLVCRLLLEKKKYSSESTRRRKNRPLSTDIRGAARRVRVSVGARLWCVTTLLSSGVPSSWFVFFFNNPAPPESSPFSLPGALPI